MTSIYAVPEPTQCLPTGLKQLERLLTVSNSLGIMQDDPHSGPQTCLKPMCIDHVMQQRDRLSQRFSDTLPSKSASIPTDTNPGLPFITMVETLDFSATKSLPSLDDDFKFLGHPTGRQDISNLREWFQYMKNKHLGFDLTVHSLLDSAKKVQKGVVIYQACARELARQVAVLCVQRGELMVEVMSFFSEIWTEFIGKVKNEYRVLQENYMNTCNRLQQENVLEAEKHKKQVKNLEKTIETLQKELSEKYEDCLVLKKRLQHIHAHEQRILKRLIYQQTSLVEKNPQPKEKLKKSQIIIHKIEGKDKEIEGKDEGNREKEEVTQVEEEKEELNATVTEGQVTSEGGVLDDFIQDKAVGDFELVENTEKDQQTDSPETILFDEKETQTDDIPAVFSVNLPIEPEKQSMPMAETLPQNPVTSQVFTDTKEEKIDDSLLSDVLETHQFQSTAGVGYTELTGKYLTEESFGQSEHTPKSTTNDTSFPHNLSQLIEGETRGSEELLGISRRKYELIAKQLEEKESQLRVIKTNIEERKTALTRLDSAIEAKQRLFRQFSSELEAAEKECKSLTEQKQALEKAVVRTKKAASQGLEGIEEVPETEDTVLLEFIPEGADVESWKAGYSLGLEKGWNEGIHAGEDLGYERAASEIKAEDASKVLREKDAHSGKSSRSTTPTRHNQSALMPPSEGKSQGNRSVLPKKIDSESVESSEDESEKTKPRRAIEEESESSSSPETSERREGSSRGGPRWRRPSTIKLKKKMQKTVTKFAEFSFQHSDLGRIWRKRQHPAPKLLEHFLRKKAVKFAKSAVMSHKMLLKFCSQIYAVAMQKVKEGVDFLLIELAYDEIDKKFVLKKVVEKKLLEVLASSLHAMELRRVSMFARLLGVAEHAGLPSFSKHSVQMYLTAYEFMLTSKIGLMVGIDETAEVQLFPLSRAIECLKDRLAAFDALNALPALQLSLERQAKVDHKRVNKSGLIELELVLELLLQEYDSYQQQIQDNLQILLELLAFSENQLTISATQVALMVRHINPDQLDMVIRSEDNKETFTPSIETAGTH